MDSFRSGRRAAHAHARLNNATRFVVSARHIRFRPPATSATGRLNNRLTDGVDGRISDKNNMK